MFSSGTTGLPKAVRHTHESMGHATAHWCGVLGLGPDDRFQIATPPSHILGLLNLFTAIAAGATVRLHRRFDLDEVLHRIASEKMTLEMAVAPIALALANHPGLEDYDLSSLRYIMWGATPVSESVAAVVTERTGVRWLPAYGASEVPVIAANPVARPSEWRLDSAGLPPDGVALRIADLETGEVLPCGEIGEVQVRSPSVMVGYLPEEATADAFADGWYRTGDVGWLEPQGWVHLTDRSKEMIKVNGFQVAPAELEAVLHGHPAVRDCAVFGVPDDRAGEVPVAAVLLDPDLPVADGELQAARGGVAGDLQATSPRRRGRGHPAPAVRKGAAARAPRRMGAVAAVARRGCVMDVRLSPEQEALRDSAAQIVDKLGPKAVGQLDDPERRARLDAAVDESGWRELRGPPGRAVPLASGVEPAIIAEELGRGLADVSFLGPTLAAELRRLAGAPPAHSGETVGLDTGLGSPVHAGDPASSPMVAIDAHGCDAALFLVPDSDGYRLARIELGPDPIGSGPHPALGGRPSTRRPPAPWRVRTGSSRRTTSADGRPWASP